MLERQLEALTGTDVSGRMRALVRAGYVKEVEDLAGRPYQIRRRGLTAIDSALGPPRSKFGAYKHDVGLAWLWLGGRGGAFGAVREVLSERRLRSEDGALDHPREPHGVRLGGFDRYGHERLHYPDLLLIDHHDRRLALELELTSKGRERCEVILSGYATDGRIDRVLYLVEDDPQGRRIGRLVRTTACEMQLSGQVYVQRIKPIRTAPGRSGSTPALVSMAQAARARAEVER